MVIVSRPAWKAFSCKSSRTLATSAASCTWVEPHAARRAGDHLSRQGLPLARDSDRRLGNLHQWDPFSLQQGRNGLHQHLRVVGAGTGRADVQHVPRTRCVRT